ncbi:MAG: AAA family ATPase [Gammaproteobacteria bacterium]
MSAAATPIDRLQDRLARVHADFARFETHISIVLLAGDDAYKFKKPVNLGFLDFSTLDARRRFCEREVALNQRYAPALYRGVRALVESPDGPGFDLAGEVTDYAVWMRRFPDAARLDRRVEAGLADRALFVTLGEVLGSMHAGAPRAAPDSVYGAAALSSAQMLADLDPLGALGDDVPAVLATYRAAVADALPSLAARKAEGFVRDCHGDLHLSNLVVIDGQPCAFDCIEFSDELRFIDTLSDFAFLKMDLEFRGHAGYAHTLLNHYLATCGDYGHLHLLRLYCAYRSMVRAKVAWIGSRSLHAAARADALARAMCHVRLAARYLAPTPVPRLLVTHGLSGSGKSWRSARLAETHGYIHLRSDIERRRLAGLAPGAASHSAPGAGLYDAAGNAATYQRLHTLAAALLRARCTVIVDATFLRAADRAAFRALARALEVPFGILACEAPAATLRDRIRRRRAAGGDPSEADEAVLLRQLARQEPLTDAERGEIVEDSSLA